MQFSFDTTPELAQQLDEQDILASFKHSFVFPHQNDKPVIYFCGNSLGLQPKNFETAIQTESQSWRELAVSGYFSGKNPWLYYQDYISPSLAKIVGAAPEEVTVMNTLTVNLHLLMLSFYRPTQQRYKIIMEAGAFPSDQYAVETLVKHFGFDPAQSIIEITPLNNEKILSTENIINIIAENSEALALVMLGGMNYYTGQFFDLQSITDAAHKAGAVAGFDLAHVAGNIPIRLHDWNVDFAAWCSYKYLNAGPGAVGGVFIHEKHCSNTSFPRLGGWWGNDEKIRFKMEKGFNPKPTAAGWNMSTAQVFNMVGLKASLEIFDAAGMYNIRQKSIQLTAYLEYLLQQLHNIAFEIITPKDINARGAQLSLFFSEKGREIHDKMLDNNIIVDYREPGVIRVAPAPLYCSYTDVYTFYRILKDEFND
ncbi:MAG: kynureninase [Bacteroidota bacterium]|nr:kynureninase [Bacteroidota bacterium]